MASSVENPNQTARISLTTPLLQRHINPFGRYDFDLARMRPEGGSGWNVRQNGPVLNGGFRLDVVSTRLSAKFDSFETRSKPEGSR
jgi:hypothetical protein